MESIVHSLQVGEINLVTILLWVLLGLLCASGAGAVSALKLAGKDIGNELALMMGSVFGPVGAVPGVIVGLVILMCIKGN